jgi:hypothetical protein
MSKRWLPFLLRALAALIVVGVVIGGGFAIHRISWSQGYRTGQLAAGGEEGAVAPYARYGLGRPGLLLTAGVLLLVLLAIGRFFRFWAWNMAWGPWMMAGGPWAMARGPRGRHWAARRAAHWHRPHGPMPPWCWGWEQPPGEGAQEQENEGEPDAEAGSAAPPSSAAA